MLKIENLTKYYGKTLGVEKLNLEIKTGEIFGFIGPNGAGKSTTIRSILDMINKTEGQIFIGTKELTRDDTKLKEIIGYLPSEIFLYEELTVKQMLEYNSSFYSKNCLKKGKELAKELDLVLNKKIEDLSLGNKKKLGIVLALMHSPKLIILDEATSGLDPLMQEKFYEILKREKAAGNTIFFSSHNLSEIKKLCDRVGIIKDGNLVSIEEISKLTTNHFNNITIKSKNISKIMKELNNETITFQDRKENVIKFIYPHDINELIPILSKYKIEKLLIEEPTIEEIFMHYYN